MNEPGYHLREIDATAEEFRYELEIPADSPLLEGHFPDNPILPGVAQVQICSNALAASLGHPVAWREVHVVRFRKTVRPGVRCELKVRRPDDAGLVLFEIENADGLIADGRLLLAD